MNELDVKMHEDEVVHSVGLIVAGMLAMLVLGVVALILPSPSVTPTTHPPLLPGVTEIHCTLPSWAARLCEEQK